MKATRNTLINRYYKLIISLFTTIIGILFICHTCNIYFLGKETGEQMYTREIINSHLQSMLIPLILYLATIITGIVFHFVFPVDKKKEVMKKEYKDLYKVYKTKFDIHSIEDKNLLSSLDKERTKRKVALLIECVICFVCLIMTTCFVFNLSFYSSDGNLIKEIINIVVHILPWVVIAYAITVIYLYFNESSYKKSFELIKGNKLNKKEISSVNGNKIVDFLHKNGVLISRITVGIISITFIILGIVNKDFVDVLNKAIKICTECIGLG